MPPGNLGQRWVATVFQDARGGFAVVDAGFVQRVDFGEIVQHTPAVCQQWIDLFAGCAQPEGQLVGDAGDVLHMQDQVGRNLLFDQPALGLIPPW